MYPCSTSRTLAIWGNLAKARPLASSLSIANLAFSPSLATKYLGLLILLLNLRSFPLMWHRMTVVRWLVQPLTLVTSSSFKGSHVEAFAVSYATHVHRLQASKSPYVS